MIGIVAAGPCLLGDEFVLRGKNAGPIKVTTTLILNQSGRPSLHMEAINETGAPIQRLALCVRSPSYAKGCLFSAWTTKELGPGETFAADASSQVKIANAMHEVTIESIEQAVLPPLRLLPPPSQPIARPTAQPKITETQSLVSSAKPADGAVGNASANSKSAESPVVLALEREVLDLRNRLATIEQTVKQLTIGQAAAVARQPQVPAVRLPARATSNCSPAVESTISGEFTGWTGETIFKLDNGQIWEQAEYDYTYSYSYRPDVTIYEVSSGCKMKVEDEDETILVRRIK